MTVLGFAAGAMTTLSFLPQVVRSARARSAHGLSWLWLVCFAAGVAAWVAYGLVRGDAAIIAANTITLSAVLVLIWLKARSAPAEPFEPEPETSSVLAAAAALELDGIDSAPPRGGERTEHEPLLRR